MLVPLKLPPGMVSNGTLHDAKGRWREGNLIRWVEGVMQPVRPWGRITRNPLPGRISGIQPARDLAQRKWLIVGGNEGLWLIRGSGAEDVTPDGYVTGYAETEVGGGYGAGYYDDGTYNTPRSTPTGLTLEADNWHFDVWGEFVVGCSTGDGRLLVWKPGTFTVPHDDKFTEIANAPQHNRALVVTGERHLMAIAADGDPRKIQWSARENYTDWAPSALNLAGDLTLETAGTLQVGLKTPNGVVVLSDVDAFLIRYIGQPYGYGRESIGTNCGIVAPHAGASVSDFAVWMGQTGFWLYRGQLQPLQCDVWDFIYRDLNWFQIAQVSCGHNADFHEVWWFFPKGKATRNSHYVMWNYRDNWWATGEISRTAWATKGVWSASLAAGSDGHIYEHEKLFSDPGAANRPKPYVTSAPFEVGNGDNVMHVTQLVPDQECRSLNALAYQFSAKFAPVCSAAEFGPYYPDESGFTDTRFVGREVQWTVRSEKDIDWRMGVLRAEVAPGGRR